MFVYRDEYYLEQHAPKPMSYDTQEKFQAQLDKWQRDMEAAHNKAELILAKQRHGPTGKIDLFFEAEFTRFADIDLVHRRSRRPCPVPCRRPSRRRACRLASPPSPPG
jgi:replicative DNA helicase